MSSVGAFSKPLAGFAVVIVGGLMRFATCSTVEGCGASKAFDEVNSPQDDKDLARCRELGRKAADAGLGGYYSYDVYYDCTKDAGLRK